ncbi:MAG: LysR family transcriptional regulator [Salinisphaeraceae bacterium]|nr:LysR family transcriptional regulator [Salinisphaeraceae bacterium]
MELRRLRYFVAVVEQGSFRNAALTLHMSQPPLTRQIHLLEESLETRLLTRGPAGTEPTSAGLMFYEEARNLLALARKAAERVRLAGQGQMGRLDVGIFGSAVLGPVPRVVREFRERYPDVEIVLHSLDRGAQIKALRERRIDVGLNRFFDPEPDLEWEVILTEPMHAVVPADHALATRPQLDLEALAAQTLILYPRAPRPGFIDHLLRLFADRDLQPDRVIEVDDVLTASGLVSAGLGLTLITDSGRGLSLPGITHVPLTPANVATVNLCVIRRAGDESPLVEALLAVARSLADTPAVSG